MTMRTIRRPVTKLEVHLSEATLNVPARDACSVLKVQMRVLRSALLFAWRNAEEGTEEHADLAALCEVAGDIEDALETLSECRQLDGLTEVTS
jgi:hypothetical protein